MVAPPPTPRRLTRDEYQRMGEIGIFDGERVELIHGSLVRMAPIGPPHANVVDRLNMLLAARLAGRVRVRVQQPFLAADDSEPEPDVAVVADVSHARSHPDRALLVVEVAQSSLEYDRDTKAPLYASSNVDEYWIVDIEGRAVLVHRQPEGGRWRSQTLVVPGEQITLLAFPDVVVVVAELLSERD